MRRNINDWERVASLAAGVVALGMALRPGSRHRSIATAGSLALLARGATGFCPVSAATGRRRGVAEPGRTLAGERTVEVEESISIEAEPHVLFAFWRDPQNLRTISPQLSHVEVLDAFRARWSARAAAGVSFSWETELTREISDELIEWRALPWSDIACEGTVGFCAIARGGTEVHVSLRYVPPAGRVGAAAAWLAGRSPASHLREALRRLKSLVETGEVPSVDGQPAGRRSTTFRLLKATS